MKHNHGATTTIYFVEDINLLGITPPPVILKHTG
jgi:hypothetical protein